MSTYCVAFEVSCILQQVVKDDERSLTITKKIAKNYKLKKYGNTFRSGEGSKTLSVLMNNTNPYFWEIHVDRTQSALPD